MSISTPPSSSRLRKRIVQTSLADVEEDDHPQKEGQLEALDDIVARQLEQVMLVELLEDRALDLREVVGDQEGQQRLAVRCGTRWDGMGWNGRQRGDFAHLVVEVEIEVEKRLINNTKHVMFVYNT